MADSLITRRFSARNSEFAAVRAFVDSVLGSKDATVRHRVVLLAEELFCNTVNHSYGGESDAPIWLTLSFDGDYCYLMYEDCGPAHDPFDSSRDPMLDAGIEDRPVGGLGIFLLTELAAHHRYDRRGNRNVVELKVACA